MRPRSWMRTSSRWRTPMEPNLPDGTGQIPGVQLTCWWGQLLAYTCLEQTERDKRQRSLSSAAAQILLKA
jgi:hypothetical protein